jgi:hypothetical protein
MNYNNNQGQASVAHALALCSNVQVRSNGVKKGQVYMKTCKEVKAMSLSLSLPALRTYSG